MDQEKLQGFQMLVRRTYNLLGEILDISKQMAEAVDRDDRVSVQMLLSMRREPIQKLADTKEQIQRMLTEQPAESAELYRYLLNGGAPREEWQKGFSNQVCINARLINQLNALDQQLNLKISRDQSVYFERN